MRSWRYAKLLRERAMKYAAKSTRQRQTRLQPSGLADQGGPSLADSAASSKADAASHALGETNGGSGWCPRGLSPQVLWGSVTWSWECPSLLRSTALPGRLPWAAILRVRVPSRRRPVPPAKSRVVIRRRFDDWSEVTFI